MQSPAHKLKFYGAWAQATCGMLANKASIPLPNNTIQSFAEAKDSSLINFYL